MIVKVNCIYILLNLHHWVYSKISHIKINRNDMYTVISINKFPNKYSKTTSFASTLQKFHSTYNTVKSVIKGHRDQRQCPQCPLFITLSNLWWGAPVIEGLHLEYWGAHFEVFLCTVKPVMRGFFIGGPTLQVSFAVTFQC